MIPSSTPISGTAAGVPFVALAPTTPSDGRASAVFAWHLMDPPRTERALAAALPLDGLDSWRIYLGLPLSGSRLPDGGYDALERLGFDDAVRHIHGPVADQGAQEFPAAFAELHDRLGFADGPIGLLGASSGAAVAQLVAAETARPAGIDIAALVLVSPVIQLEPIVDALAARYGFRYDWDDTSRGIAERLDFVARADELTAAGAPAVRIIVGEGEDATGVVEPAERLCAALRAGRGHDAADLIIVAGMAHTLADEPGIDPAPQTAGAAIVDRYAVEWLRRHLTGGVRA